MSSKVLWQLQLSNYTKEGKFVLTADSNWQVFATKATNLVKLDPNFQIDVIVPELGSCLEDPLKLLSDINPDLVGRVTLIEVPIIANALVTRFDFPWKIMTSLLGSRLNSYTHVYINDPLLFPHYKALFKINSPRSNPKWILQTHFLDSPVAKVVDADISYWHGTIEACTKADVFLWHCTSMQDVFEEALAVEHLPTFIDPLMAKSDVWKDGYSIDEIRKPINKSNIRFDTEKLDGKLVVWVPNRIGGLGKSFDYTNNGKFMFEIIPEVWKNREDFVVVAGNPNQKITNDELASNCPAYMKLVDGPLNRDEYRYFSQRADVVVGLYTNDTNGGLASLESIEFYAIPYFPNIYEYKVYFDAVDWPEEYRILPDLSDAATVFSRLIDAVKLDILSQKRKELQNYIRSYAAYENTTQSMWHKLGF